MKTFKVSVSDDKKKFFIELMESLDWKWELLGSKGITKEVEGSNPPSYEVDKEARKVAAKVREESLKDVINKIEQLRNR